MPIFKKRDAFPTQGHGLLAVWRVVNIGEVPDEGLQDPPACIINYCL
jgi:hypothetical protein